MQSRSLSVFARTGILESMSETVLDLLVIGGGITGAGIALDAAARGLAVGLVEKQDFAAGTSSRSTKLIHGGLRYLKQGEVGLVREVGRERAILFRNAPHIVIPEKMLLPLVQGGTYGKLATSAGLWLYDRLAGVEKAERRIMLSKEETAKREPLLRTDILKGGGLYYEYRTDDARLTIEVIKTAAAHGAMCVNYAEAAELVNEGGKLAAVIVRDVLNGGAPYRIRAKKVVNATGPWADLLRRQDGSLTGKRLHLTKGVHLVVARERLPLRQSVYFDVADGRMVFAIPRDGTTYIGTTDTDYDGPLEQPAVTRGDVEYLLNAVNGMFPSVRLQPEHVESSWAGLRPLIHEDGKSPSELSRKDEIFVSPSGLITIAGGKLTGYRKMAERVVDLVFRQLGEEEGRSFVPCGTDRIVLSGGRLPKRPAEYAADLRERFSYAGEEAVRLVYRYGTGAESILQRGKEEIGNHGEMNIESVRQTLLMSELDYALREEMVCAPEDFVIRRTGDLYFRRRQLNGMLPVLVEGFARAFGWDEAHANTMRERLEAVCEAAVRFET